MTIYTVTVYRRCGTDTFDVYDQLPKITCDFSYWQTCNNEMRMFPTRRIVKVVVKVKAERKLNVMANDADIVREIQQIDAEFSVTESDGLDAL